MLRYQIQKIKAALSPDDLSPEEQKLFKSLHHSERSQQFLWGRKFVKELVLQQYPQFNLPELAIYGTKPNEKPRCYYQGKLLTDIDVNVSHKAPWVFAAMSTTGKIGVDIESIYTKALKPSLIKFLCVPEELDLLKNENPQEIFTHLWTIKEACLKALGLGLAQHTQKLKVNFMKKQAVYLNQTLYWQTAVYEGHYFTLAGTEPLFPQAGPSKASLVYL
ncbi:MAG: 4'-phosphopantetheinyl transferase superfamily protein [Deltaproteobacteria bacterium]|nr:4'-phosphopantetheinyl transferase superfamily protein [Deltaproteobacteria bacterium]